MDNKPTRGGKRPGAGRPRLENKRVKESITMTPEHHRATRINRSKIVEEALNAYLSNRRPTSNPEG